MRKKVGKFVRDEAAGQWTIQVIDPEYGNFIVMMQLVMQLNTLKHNPQQSDLIVDLAVGDKLYRVVPSSGDVYELPPKDKIYFFYMDDQGQTWFKIYYRNTGDRDNALWFVRGVRKIHPALVGMLTGLAEARPGYVETKVFSVPDQFGWRVEVRDARG